MSIELVKEYKSKMDFALEEYGRSRGTDPEAILRVLRMATKVLPDILKIDADTFSFSSEKTTEDVEIFYDKVKIYIEAVEQQKAHIMPERKIKVFISSKCGDEGKYDRIRSELKAIIESTNLAEVYMFEEKPASTLSAGSHYTWALEDSDVCIFLIDNNDGIPDGVQAEIDTVRKREIKALYYFCAETSKEKTPLEQSLMGAKFSKSRTVQKFDELSSNSAQALINDIVDIYHYYCVGKFNEYNLNEEIELQSIALKGTENLIIPTMPKTILKNVDKCKSFILEHVTGQTHHRWPDDPEKTGEIDEWGVQFLSVLLNGVSIKQFNVGMFLESLKKEQTEQHYNVVNIRWQAIQEYFSGNIAKCVEKLEESLKLARDTNQPAWVVKDILIDLRNQHWNLSNINNSYSESAAQKELTESSEELYYPVLDRINESLHEKYVEGLYKEQTTSPYTVTMGNNLDPYGDLLASAFIISIYNGSLTHILMFHDKLKDFLFYLSCRYDGWTFKRDLLKVEVYAGKHKEIKGLQDSYPEILNNMSSDDAILIMNYCNNHTIKHRKLISQLIGLGTVGYYLDDKNYSDYETLIIKEIRSWLNEEKPIYIIGDAIFKCLSGICHRMSQDILAEICCLFMEKHYSRWYMDMFRFLAKSIDLNKMSESSAKKLIKGIILVLENENEREQIKYAPTFLFVFRKQNKILTEKLDEKIAQYLPKYYEGDYKLETTENEQQDIPKFIRKYVEQIKENNETQGKNGTYFGRGVRESAVIRSIILSKTFDYDEEIMNSIISATADTLLLSKESLRTKLDAISLLICIVLTFPDDFKRNYLVYEKLYEQKENIERGEHSSVFSNIDTISLRIGLLLLYTAMGKDTYSEILEIIPYLQNDIPTTISVINLMVEYLYTNDSVQLPQSIEMIIMQNVLYWLRSENLDVRWGATRIMFALLRNTKNENIINNQLIHLIESQNVYIKNLILRNMVLAKRVTKSTRDYIISRCENDSNYVVRLVCSEVKKELT